MEGIVDSPIRSSRFLNVGAGFVLTKANLFPTEAARGGAQIVLVRSRGSTMYDVCSRRLTKF